MEANNINNFISELKDHYFRVLEDEFPGITREEFNKLFDDTITIEKI